MVRSTVSSNFAYLTCLSRLTASGSGYAGLVTAARAFAIFLLTLAIHPSSPTAFASPVCTGSPFQFGCQKSATLQGFKSRGASDMPGTHYWAYLWSVANWQQNCNCWQFS